MRLLEKIQTKNPSYTRNRSIKPIGIFVHSTGASNNTLKRYVDYPEVLGTNLFNNHWNKSDATKSMHAFIGLDKDNIPTVVQTLPYDRACWGAGGGSKGSANYDPQAHLQFEVCEDHAPRSGKPPTEAQRKYYNDIWALTEDYCVHLCKMFGWTEKNITSHYEMAAKGYASNHGDPRNWMSIYNDSMDKFRSRVAAKLKGIGTPPITIEPDVPVVTIPDSSSPYKVKVKISREENATYYKKNIGDIVEIDLEEYVRGVVPSEVGNSPYETCKAQAVAARTVAVRNKANVLVDTTSLQAYRAPRNNAKLYPNAIKAVNDTYGQVLTYDGKVIDCYYSSSNGGSMRVPEHTWRLNLPLEQRGNSRPYYKEGADLWTVEPKNGHGIGMSQLGATKAATLGTSYVHILQFYYKGVAITDYYNNKVVDPPTSQYTEPTKPIEESEVPDMAATVLYRAIVQTSKPLSLNLWKRPSKLYDSYKLIPKGDTVEVLEEISSKWVKVRHGTQVGYVDPQYLVKVATDPIVPDAPATGDKVKDAINQAIKILQEALK